MVNSYDALLKELEAKCSRPHFAERLVNNLVQLCDAGGVAGPIVELDGIRCSVREALARRLRVGKMYAKRGDARKKRIGAEVALELISKDGHLDIEKLEKAVAERVEAEGIRTTMNNVSSCVGELEEMGVVKTTYMGYKTPHEKHGGLRNAVYRLKPEIIEIMRPGVGCGQPALF